MKGKKKTLLVLALLLLVGLTSGYVANTYAKYVHIIEDKKGTAEIAKWKFKTENEATTLTINITDKPNIATLSDGKIAPGTSGSFDIKLLNAETDTGVDFTIKFKETSNVPTNLKFYTKTGDARKEFNSTNAITGQLKANDTEGLTVPIYWEWPYGTEEDVLDTINQADTTDGEEAAAATDENRSDVMTITVDIIGAQTKPSTTGFESHVD